MPREDRVLVLSPADCLEHKTSSADELHQVCLGCALPVRLAHLDVLVMVSDHR